MRLGLVFFMTMLLAMSAQAAPELTYCFTDDVSCSLGDSSSEAMFTENLSYIVNVYAKSASGDPQEDNWCVAKMRWDMVTVSGPGVGIGFQNFANLEEGVGHVGANPYSTNLEHAFYLLNGALDNSIVDGTTETTLGKLGMRSTTGSQWPAYPAPCSDTVVQLVPVVAPDESWGRPSGISLTNNGCGGADTSDGMSVNEMLFHEEDYDIDTPTTLTVTVISDHDADAIPNNADNCMYHSNHNQANINEGYGEGEDLQGNACDPDWTNDGNVGSADFIILSSEWGCSTTIGKCDDTNAACTLFPNDCSTGTCVACFNAEHDTNGDGETSSAEMVLMSALWGHDMDEQNICSSE